MKRKDGFIVRQIADQNVAVAVGEASRTFRGMIKLNGTGLMIWNLLEDDITENGIVAALTERYEVDDETARADVRRFIAVLAEAGIVE